MSVTYEINGHITAEEAIGVLRAGDFLRPLDSVERVDRMLRHADVLVTARDGERLAGYVRALTDYSYYCLIAEIAVYPEYQRQGIGRELLERVRREAGDEVNMVLTASENADTWYPHLGWERMERAWRLRRSR